MKKMCNGLLLASSAGLAISATAQGQILNGDFETGTLANWTTTAILPPPVIDNVTFHGGAFSALLGSNTGAEPLGDGAMYQSFAVPAGGGTLSFWYTTFTTDTITFDWQDAYIQDSAGTTLATIFHLCQNGPWAQQLVDLAPYAGTTIRIAFLVHQDGFGDDTSMNVDDVLLGPPAGTGACCKFDGSCIPGISPIACTAQGGVYQGNGTVCGSCPSAPPVIYTNCNLTTGTTTLSGVGGLPAGSQWSECARDAADPTTANTTAGFGGSGALRLADDFVVPAGGMNLGYVRAYAYLTGAAAPGVTAATLQIWNGPPNGGGAVIFGDTTTNRLANNSFAPVYRTFNTVTPPACGGAATLPGQTRHVQYVYLTVNQFLPAGTYWIDFNYTGASFSPCTTTPSAIGRQCSPANNGLQFNAAWVPLNDAGQGCAPVPVIQDIAFDLLGTPGAAACYANCDQSTTLPCLNVLDFSCFLNQFAAGATYANCDNSTVVPVLNVLDFSCFLNKFAAGCSNC